MKKQIKEKITPLKKNLKINKEFILEYREFFEKDSWLVLMMPEIYKPGWTKWKLYKAYKKIKDLNNAHKRLVKDMSWGMLGVKIYEYRIKK